MVKTSVQEFHIKPLTGLLEARVTTDEVPLGGYRWVKNFESTDEKRVCRATGWTRLQKSDDYNNEDLHDQLLSLVNYDKGPEFVIPAVDQPIIFLHEAQDSYNINHLFAATQNRLYSKVQSTGNWRLIWDTLPDGGQPGKTPSTGHPNMQWTAACVGDTVVFSNSVDPPVYHVIDQPAIEEWSQSVSRIKDLDSLQVSRAGVVVAWNNIVLYMDVTQDGRRRTNRILWSDYKKPISVKPNPDVSMGGYKDLDSGEVILAAKSLANTLLIYTTKGIWQAEVADESTVFTFSKRYDPERRGIRTLAYPRTLVSDGDSHWYMGTDGIYRYNFYTAVPERVAWVHKATSIIYNDLKSGNCMIPCSGYELQKKTLWFSWAQRNDTLASQSIRINLQYPFVSYCDYGITAFGSYGPQTIKSTRDFILQNCICVEGDLDDSDWGFIKEGQFCSTQDEFDCAGEAAQILVLVNIDTGDNYDIKVRNNEDGTHELYISGISVTPVATDAFALNNDDGLTYQILVRNNPDGEPEIFLSAPVGSEAEDIFLENEDDGTVKKLIVRDNPDGDPEWALASGFAAQPDSIYTDIEITDPDYPELTYEDFDQPEASAESLCARLTVEPDEDCSDEATGESCESEGLFLFASSKDFCIKQASDIYYREHCLDTASCGQYQNLGYKSVLRSGSINLGNPEREKDFRRFSVEAFPAIQSVPSLLQLRFGVAHQAVDPNEESDRCFIMWEDEDPLALECLSKLNESESRAEWTRPDGELAWPLFLTGRYMYYELTIENPNVSPVDTGGQCCFSRFSFHVALRNRTFD